MNPIEFLPGTRVRYVPSHAYGDKDHPDCEDGTVSSNNDKNVFVRFDKQVLKLGWNGTTSQSCSPQDLLSTHVIVNPLTYFSARAVETMALHELMSRAENKH